MKISGTILRANAQDFVIKPNMHIEIMTNYQYVPFVSDGVVIKYGNLKKLAKMSGINCQDMVAKEVGKVMEFEVTRKVVRKKGEIGEIYKSLYFICQDILD